MPKSARDRIMFPYNFSEFRQAGQSSDLMFSAKEELAGTLRDFGDLVEAIESHPEDFKNISWTTMAKRPVRIPNHVALAKFIVEQCNLMTKAFDEVAKQMEKAPDIVDADFATPVQLMEFMEEFLIRDKYIPVKTPELLNRLTTSTASLEEFVAILRERTAAVVSSFRAMKLSADFLTDTPVLEGPPPLSQVQSQAVIANRRHSWWSKLTHRFS